MYDVVFKHLKTSRNIGDRTCSPQYYIPFENSTTIALKEPTPACNAVIYGGGQIFGRLYQYLGSNDLAARSRIAWGVGTVESSFLSFYYKYSRKNMTLIGSRDYGDNRYEFAPCPTCLSPLFDKKYEEKHEVVFYYHRKRSNIRKLNIPTGVPSMDNYCKSLDAALNFIGSGRVVVSNSYHGVFWGLLLGKKVICIPYSQKFKNFRIAPGYARAGNWNEQINMAIGSDEMLGLSREATERFYEKVKEQIYPG